MADGVQLNPGVGGAIAATDEIAGQQYQRIKLVLGADGVNDGDVAAGNPVPVALATGSEVELGATTLAALEGVTVTGPLTDTQLRATAVPVSGTVAVTGTFWQATQAVSGTFWQTTQPVSGPLTDVALRATPVPVSISGSIPVTIASAIEITNDAGSPIPVSGEVTLDAASLAALETISVANFPATQPVSGTFWQATQPVSGTFWQATQPVSGPLTDAELRAAAVPVSGTFYQGTQPVSGTFWQATQPVSGTFYQATQPVSAAQLPASLGIKAASASLSVTAATEDATARTAANASLASLDAKTPALGQALGAASTPVVLPSTQLATLTPPAAITGFSTAAKQPTLGTGVMAGASPVTLATDDTQIGAKTTGSTLSAGGSGIIGWLSDAVTQAKALILQLPTSLGIQTAAASMSIAPASDAVFSVGSVTAVNSGTFTRPSDTTQYAVGDLVANSTTAGSVVAISVTATRLSAGSAVLRRARLRKSSVGITNTSFRVHLFIATPTVANGDNGAISMTGVANYIGKIDILLDQTFTDGAYGSSDIGFADFNIKLSSGSTVYALIEARAAYTPVSAETFTLHLEFLQD